MSQNDLVLSHSALVVGAVVATAVAAVVVAAMVAIVVAACFAALLGVVQRSSATGGAGQGSRANDLLSRFPSTHLPGWPPTRSRSLGCE